MQRESRLKKGLMLEDIQKLEEEFKIEKRKMDNYELMMNAKAKEVQRLQDIEKDEGYK